MANQLDINEAMEEFLNGEVDDLFDDDDLDDLEEPFDPLADAIGEFLETECTTTVNQLVEFLVEDGAVAPGSDQAELRSAVERQLSGMYEVWRRGDRVARTDHLLAGRVFTHRLTALDLRLGGLAHQPDLVVLWRGGWPVDLTDGTRLSVTTDPETGWRGLIGPAGWLSDRAEGDLVGLRHTASGWKLEEVTAPEGGPAESSALRARLAPVIDAGVGGELAPALLDVLLDEPGLFRRPTIPIDELLTEAGLTTDGSFAGPADRVWYRGHVPPDLEVSYFAHRHGLERCCRPALAQVAAHWRAHVLGLADTVGATVAVDTVQALGHGTVAEAMVDLIGLPRPDNNADSFVASLLAHAPDAAGSLLLAGLVSDRSGRQASAEQHYRRVLAVAPQATPALFGLAWQSFDAGDFYLANRLARQASGPGHKLVRLTEELMDLFPTPGRNEPCPCGSGRKYKACHHGELVMPAAVHHLLLQRKIDRFLMGDDSDFLFDRISAAGLSLSEVDATLACDLVLLDVDCLVRYRAARGALLPPIESERLDKLIAARVRLIEVRCTDGDGEPTFWDAVDHEQIPGRLPAEADQPASGEVGLVRLVDGEIIGCFTPVSPLAKCVAVPLIRSGATDQRILLRLLAFLRRPAEPELR